MPCYHPLEAWRGRKGGVVFDKSESCGARIQLPCGQCIGCRLERSRQWAVRCMHEASLHDENSFITLTYADEHLPSDGSLQKKDFQDFMKRLRWRYRDRSIRYFQCGEYGEQLARPHYHACLFGFDFPDKVLWKRSAGGVRLWTSEVLASLWPFGFSTVGAVTFDSAAYVARYVLKKFNGEDAAEHYARVNLLTGELVVVQPEYVCMSRRPGIARGWIERFRNEVECSDSVVVRGFECKPPRYYDEVSKAADLSAFEVRKSERMRKALVHAADQVPERLRVREVCAAAKVASQGRELERGSGKTTSVASRFSPSGEPEVWALFDSI